MEKVILCLNMATFSGGFSLLSCDGQTIFNCQENEGYPWATSLVLRLKNGLQQLGCSFSSIDKIIFTKGPGSFTGIRIGIAVVATLNQFLKIPVIDVTTLQVWAAFAQLTAQQRNYSCIQVGIDSKRPDFYTQQFCSETLSPLSPITMQYPHTINIHQNILFTGDALGAISVDKSQLFCHQSLPADTLKYFQNHSFCDWANFSPLYFNSPVKKP